MSVGRINSISLGLSPNRSAASPAPASPYNNVTFEDETKVEKRKSRFSRFVNSSWVRPKSRLNLLTRLAKGAVLGTAIVGTTPFWVGINEASKSLGLVPEVKKIQSEVPEYSQLSLISPLLQTTQFSTHNTGVTGGFDHFVKNYPGFNIIEDALKQANFDPAEFDTNNDGFILDNEGDFKSLTLELTNKLNNTSDTSEKELYKKAIDLLNELDIISYQLWRGKQVVIQRTSESNVRPRTEITEQVNLEQVGYDECAITADYVGIYKTQNNIQKFLRSNIRVTKTTPNKDILEMEITLPSGSIHKVSYSDLISWMQNAPDPHMSFDPAKEKIPLAPYAFMYASYKEINRTYGEMPEAFKASVASELITGEEHYTIPTWAFSDSALKEIFKEAPQTPSIKLVTYPDYLGGTQPSNIGSSLIEEHVYAVVRTKNVDGKFKVIISDTIEDEKSLSIKDVRRDIVYISLPVSKQPLTNDSLRWAFALVSILGLTFGEKAYEKRKSLSVSTVFT